MNVPLYKMYLIIKWKTEKWRKAVSNAVRHTKRKTCSFENFRKPFGRQCFKRSERMYKVELSVWFEAKLTNNNCFYYTICGYFQQPDRNLRSVRLNDNNGFCAAALPKMNGKLKHWLEYHHRTVCSVHCAPTQSNQLAENVIYSGVFVLVQNSYKRNGTRATTFYGCKQAFRRVGCGFVFVCLSI